MLCRQRISGSAQYWAKCWVLWLALAAVFPVGDAGAGDRAGGAGFDPRLCQALTRHHPAPDVAYIPGVDVRGKPVAPADLPNNGGHGFERFEIPVTLDFARRMGFSGGRIAASGGLPGATEVGRLTVDGDRMTFNGQPIGGASESALLALCGRRR